MIENLFGSWIYPEHPQNAFFFVAAIAAGVDADSRKLAALAPALDGESGNTQEGGDFGDSQKIGEISEIDFFLLFNV